MNNDETSLSSGEQISLHKVKVLNQLRLLACQINVPPMITAAQRDKHLAFSAQQLGLELEQHQGVDLVVLPELSTLEYSRACFEQLDQLSEPLHGSSFDSWRAVAIEYDVAILYSFALRAEEGTYICAAMVNNKGALCGHYNKIHLAQYGASMEKEYFQRGAHLFIFELNGFKLAPIICYDIRIPELSRTLVLDHKVDVILHCGAYFRDESFGTWHDFAKTRAIENQVFLLSLNRAGADYGNSIFCLPWMDENNQATLFPQADQAFSLLTLDRLQLVEAREKYAFLIDRLADYTLPILSTDKT